MSTELVAQDMGMPTGIALRDPKVILEEAGDRAKALTDMVERTKAFTQIGPSKHLRVEAWITVGQFYGCSARITNTEEVSFNGVFGFKAHARVTHDASGQTLTEAEALCMQDEKNWDSKPLHQLMSMAQTRAISKALAMKFRWVVTLGGFAPTPAEEMTGTEYAQQVNEPHKKEPSKKEHGGMRLPFGRSKGKALDDETVPLDDLNLMLGYVTQNVGSAKRKAYEKQDREMIELLSAEIKKRSAAQPELHSMSDEEWTDFCALNFSTHEEQYTQASLDFKCADPSVIALDKRLAFQKHLNGLVSVAAAK